MISEVGWSVWSSRPLFFKWEIRSGTRNVCLIIFIPKLRPQGDQNADVEPWQNIIKVVEATSSSRDCHHLGDSISLRR